MTNSTAEVITTWIRRIEQKKRQSNIFCYYKSPVVHNTIMRKKIFLLS